MCELNSNLRNFFFNNSMMPKMGQPLKYDSIKEHRLLRVAHVVNIDNITECEFHNDEFTCQCSWN